MHLERLEASGTMTKQKEIQKEDMKKKDMALRLRDSMGFYRQKGIETNSPPKLEPQALLVGDDDDELGAEEGSPFERKLFVDQSDGDDEEGESLDEEGDAAIEIEEADEHLEYGQRNFDNDSSSDDDIVFGDSDSEEEEKGEELQTGIPSTPFWFGNEEKDQLRCINEHYASALNLDEEKKRRLRQPPPFVGRVERTKVNNGIVFTTLDVVEVYSRSLLPPGSVMPFERKAIFLTEWSTEEGVPLHLNILHTEALWKKRAIVGVEPSVLLCMPEYGTNDYEFSVASPNTEVTHSPSSLQTIEQRSWYDKYIPEDLRHPPPENEKPVVEPE